MWIHCRKVCSTVGTQRFVIRVAIWPVCPAWCQLQARPSTPACHLLNFEFSLNQNITSPLNFVSFVFLHTFHTKKTHPNPQCHLFFFFYGNHIHEASEDKCETMFCILAIFTLCCHSISNTNFYALN